MQTDVQTANESAAPNSRELAVLKKYFPQCFGKDGDAFDMVAIHK